MDRPFPAYKGNEPYIFVSYSHNDAAVVFQELIWMSDLGFNIWYDEGIEAGSEWREEIANAITNTCLFLYFVSHDSARSENCRKEVNLADRKHIPILAIHLETTDLPGSLDLTLSDRQAVFRYEIPKQEYQQKLQSRISSYLAQRQTDEATRHPAELAVSSEPAKKMTQASIPGAGSASSFEIEGITRLAPPRRGLGESSVIMFLSLVMTLVVGASVGFYLRAEDKIYIVFNDDLIDIHQIVLMLNEKNTPALVALWGGLDRPARELITRHVNTELDKETMRYVTSELRKSFNSLIASDVFILGAQEDDLWTEKLKTLRREHAESDESAKINREVLSLLFENQIQRWLSSPDFLKVLTGVLNAESFVRYGLPIFLILVWLWSTYCYALGTVQIIFKDTRDVDAVMDYLVREMGFKPPVQEKNGLVFNATIFTMFLYTILKLRVNISGNKVLMTAPLPMVRRIEKRLLSLATTPQSVITTTLQSPR